MKAATVLILLFLAALAGMEWQKHQRELAEQRRDIAERAVEQAGDVLAEVRALRADVGEIEAGMKKLSKKRGTNGEQRRETIKTALDGETCAVTPVPAAVADSLQKRTAEVRSADYSGAFAGQPDGKH
ncbi:DUF2570 domain-containing protein [Serratia marcescens]|uniref:DUF2570 domain-containing protein n=1 Tax=Serratia marcescens TaxID=615 RepID=UPI0013CD7A14|nr:DUF2570 domain-containing protein [Serratia marcescens]NDY32716.1 DUF2570 domain-containing protein [Serratia marcescens]NDY37610.1 DUF2570 domain-containing protein [Serratia marcescens]